MPAPDSSRPGGAGDSDADAFALRHIGPRPEQITAMLAALGFERLEDLSAAAVPASIRSGRSLATPGPLSEAEALADLAALAGGNRVLRSFLGLGFHDTLTPPVIQRNVLENPGWYTQYTPYQAEISQGRLEAMLNFQTMIGDLTALPVSNASVLDESTAAAEAMTLCRRALDRRAEGRPFFVSERCHQQTIEVVAGRAEPLGIEVVVGAHETVDFAARAPFGVLVQYPATDGEIVDYEPFLRRAHEAGALCVVAADLLALALLRAPGEFGADVAVGTSQRFGVPLGYGGPHAGFMAVRDELKRHLPGRLVGVSRDSSGRPAMRLSLQTREQHIRREKATSNICTAQVLLAVVASMYAVYHGPRGLTAIARRVHRQTARLARALEGLGCRRRGGAFFDTIQLAPAKGAAREVLARARAAGINLRPAGEEIAIALDETVTKNDLEGIVAAFGGTAAALPAPDSEPAAIAAPHARTSGFLTHPVFHRHHSETAMLRYLKALENRDLSLTASMIPLGSCTMKLNAAAEMYPISYAGFSKLHPFVPAEQAEGYRELFRRLEAMLAELTGLPAVSLQPNAGSQGEYAGLLAIRAWHRSRGETKRTVCLIPVSAHGTNPASASMAGMTVVVVACDAAGNIDIPDLRAKAAAHRDRLAALMVTYPSTHGVFEEGIREISTIVHDAGGLVYLDGANLNALVGLCRPGEFGADVCHLNLHKTFCIPHGGGGPGMGPICATEALRPFLPRHPFAEVGGREGIRPVSEAPWGSASILPISYAYIAMMGPSGLRRATEAAILNANYLAKRLDPHFPVLYKGAGGLVAHECIVDLRPVTASANVTADDVAKRLMDYGFHAPTMSWPVAGTLMIEPTESEPLEELDRFCEAMIAIRQEIREIETGEADREVNFLKMAPHTAEVIAADAWDRPYSRRRAAFPVESLRERKFWPAVGRVDNAWGDRNLVCSCLPVEAYAEAGG